nr:MAG TPA: hypothetical protein [Caudoviricetes sp.]
MLFYCTKYHKSVAFMFHICYNINMAEKKN